MHFTVELRSGDIVRTTGYNAQDVFWRTLLRTHLRPDRFSNRMERSRAIRYVHRQLGIDKAIGAQPGVAWEQRANKWGDGPEKVYLILGARERIRRARAGGMHDGARAAVEAMRERLKECSTQDDRRRAGLTHSQWQWLKRRVELKDDPNCKRRGYSRISIIIPGSKQLMLRCPGLGAAYVPPGRCSAGRNCKRRCDYSQIRKGFPHLRQRWTRRRQHVILIECGLMVFTSAQPPQSRR